MKQSKLFTKTTKNVSSDEPSLNAQLLIKAGFISKEMSGVYAFLPLGLRTLNKIVDIIREEMDKIGGQEVHLSSLQRSEVWEKSGRWDDKVLDVWFKTKLKNGKDLGLATTHEEPLTEIMKSFIHSYKDLPLYIYQFQRKFRNELRSKSGLLRGREFLMKDLYSFNENQEGLDKFYEKAIQAYTNVFNRVGLGDYTYLTFASGGSFSKYSHEFQTICNAGEDVIYVDDMKRIAINKEVYTDEVLSDLKVEKEKLKEVKAIEVGNIFKLGTKFSDALNLNYVDAAGESKKVIMGSYGIGPSRVMGTIVELHNDENGMIWPDAVSPYKVHLISLAKTVEDESYKKAESLYLNFQKEGIEVLWDDRVGVSAGSKFSDSDLIGIPNRIIVSEKTLASDSVEFVDRKTKETKMIKIHSVLDLFK